jgi:hypothetical protein
VARSKVKNYIKLDPRFSRLGDQPIRFLEAQTSANPMISRPSSHPMKFLEGVEFRFMSDFSKFVTVEISFGKA